MESVSKQLVVMAMYTEVGFRFHAGGSPDVQWARGSGTMIKTTLFNGLLLGMPSVT